MIDESTGKRIFSLFEVTKSIQKTLSERYSSTFWVKAEMIKLNHYTHSGHCYPDLVEKKNGRVISQMKAVLWKSDFIRIDERFRSVLKEPLKDGINILFCASVTFDPTYGLSLTITDIDPAFSLGELEREKQETIDRLTREGIFNNNRSLSLSLLPQRIAVISVETSKGYADYLKMIERNPGGYKFLNLLFPSLLQGERSVGAIIHQLRRIRRAIHHFDAVAIIRGGGGDLGLSSYNNYHLAREIALFPIPVFTGIGHATNETVTEMVSFKNAITPTDLAEFLLKRFDSFSTSVDRASEVVCDRSERLLSQEKNRMDNTLRFFQSVTGNHLIRNRGWLRSSAEKLKHGATFHVHRESIGLNRLAEQLEDSSHNLLASRVDIFSELTRQLGNTTEKILSKEHQSLSLKEQAVKMLDPVNILRRGFTITLKNGKSVKHISEIEPGDVITTILEDGKVTSTVTT